MTFIKIYKWLGFGVMLILTILLYKNYNPMDSDFLPKCPLWSFTGIKCPGCGSQRAIHHLLSFHVLSAIQENILLVFSIPYLLIVFVTKNIKKPSAKLISFRNKFFDTKATYIILFIVIIFWIYRNVILYLK